MYFGLSGLDLAGQRIEFPRGIVLEETYAHLMAPMLVALARPAQEGQPHPAPWYPTRGGFGRDITAQLLVPEHAGNSLEERYQLATVIVFLIRLWADPSIYLSVLADMPFSSIPNAQPAQVSIVPIEYSQRGLALNVEDKGVVVSQLKWVSENFENGVALIKSSAAFALAVKSIESAQGPQSSALTLVSAWAALEGIFSPSKQSELRFRISALIASYLCPVGINRQRKQKRIAALYDIRSSAVHGAPKHTVEELIETLELLRAVLIKCIGEKHVPTKDELEMLLFGVELPKQSRVYGRPSALGE